MMGPEGLDYPTYDSLAVQVPSYTIDYHNHDFLGS